MSKILVFLQVQDSKVIKASLCALSAAKQFGAKHGISEIAGVSIGQGAKAAAESVSSFGFSALYFCDSPETQKYLAPNYESAILKAVEASGSTILFGGSTSTGKDVLPRVAARLDAGQASDVVAVNEDGSLRRPMYAGDVLADVEITTKNKVISVRASAFTAATSSGGSCSVQELSGITFTSGLGEVVGYEIAAAERPELGDAEIVVSGGRALGSSENFEKIMFPLADSLGAAVGASRAAVDSGYAPNDWQVGQTGKIVAPNLYIAVGVSGAIQHLAGMKDSRTIVAINKDSEAPIFEVADYGLVADLFAVVPELTEAIKKAKS